MIEHAEALGLEQRCIEPGHWLIEGRRVKRVVVSNGGRRNGHRIEWRVTDYSADIPILAMTDTLREAREWIFNQIRGK